MTNLDSILKSRDVTLPTKVHLVKAMVFPVVMYGCETWTIEKAVKGIPEFNFLSLRKVCFFSLVEDGTSKSHSHFPRFFSDSKK